MKKKNKKPCYNRYEKRYRSKHSYKLRVDSDGNYKLCIHCQLITFRGVY